MTQALNKEPKPREISDRVNNIISQYQRTQIKKIENKTSNYTLTINDNTIKCDATAASFTVTLPKANNANGYIFNIKKVDSTTNTITIDGDGSETIDGSLTMIIVSQYDCITVHSDGTQWWII